MADISENMDNQEVCHYLICGTDICLGSCLDYVKILFGLRFSTNISSYIF